MKKKSILCLVVGLLLLTSSGFSYGQDTLSTPENKPSNWKLKSIFGLNGTQTSFVNWNAGGRNNLSLIGFISASADFKKNKWEWNNNLELALGGVRYLDSTGDADGLQKTDDKIDYATNVGYKLKEHWYASLAGGLRTQFLDGFNFPNDSVRVSTFMAPGYVNLALGLEYKPDEHFTAFLSPLATKMTIVNDQRLADQGAFGVKDAVFDTSGHVISNGSRFRGEFGAYLKVTYNKEVAKNVNFKGRLEMFSNYAVNPENIDVNADMLWTFKVNNWLSASLNWTLIYDDDIQIRDVNGNTGPRTQFKSVLGLGISYTAQNFKEK